MLGLRRSRSTSFVRRSLPGASATFNYKVDVSKGAGVDSGWVVTGAITVSNANDWDVAADLADSAPGGSCVLAQTSVTVPANDSVAVGYSCSFASGASGTNTATASWDSVVAQTPSGTASATADYAFDQPSKLVNDSVQVYDNGNLLGPTDHSIQFSYPKSFPGTAGTCTTHDNTATVKNNQTLLATSNTVTVEVCAGGSDLTVTKTASSSFTRTFAWAAQKSVDQLRQTVAAGCECDLQLQGRCEQGRRCGFRLGGDWCDHGQQRERLGCCSRSG